LFTFDGGFRKMKKIILCLSLFVLVSTCFVTNAMATPQITGIHGGYGVTATVVNAKGLDWKITINGPAMIYGMKTVGIISDKSATIHTPIATPAFGFGPIKITVTINRIILHDVIVIRSGIILGPFVLLVK
jgi:hypothetical protein